MKTKLLSQLKAGDRFSLAKGESLRWIEILEVFRDGTIKVQRGVGKPETWDAKDVAANGDVFVPDSQE